MLIFYRISDIIDFVSVVFLVLFDINQSFFHISPSKKKKKKKKKKNVKELCVIKLECWNFLSFHKNIIFINSLLKIKIFLLLLKLGTNISWILYFKRLKTELGPIRAFVTISKNHYSLFSGFFTTFFCMDFSIALITFSLQLLSIQVYPFNQLMLVFKSLQKNISLLQSNLQQTWCKCFSNRMYCNFLLCKCPRNLQWQIQVPFQNLVFCVSSCLCEELKCVRTFDLTDQSQTCLYAKLKLLMV